MVEAIGAPTAQAADVTPKIKQINNQEAGDVDQMNDLMKNQESTSDAEAANIEEEFGEVMTNWIVNEIKKVVQRSEERRKELDE